MGYKVMEDEILKSIKEKTYSIVESVLYICFIIYFMIKGFYIRGNVWETCIKYIVVSYCCIGGIRYGIPCLFNFCREYLKTSGAQFIKRIILLGVILCIMAMYFDWSKIIDFFYNTQVHFVNMVSVNNVDITMTRNVFLFSIPLLIIIFKFLINKHLEFLISAIIFIALVVMYNLGYKPSIDKMIPIFIAINFIIFGLRSTNIKKNYNQKDKYNIVMVVSVALIVASIGNNFSFDYKGLKDKFGSKKTGFTTRNLTGLYDSSNKMGGPISLDNKLAFKYSFPNGVTTGYTYFKADTEDYYTGKSWIKSQTKTALDVKKLKSIVENIIKVSDKYKNDVEIYPAEEVKDAILSPNLSYNITMVNKEIKPTFDERRSNFNIPKSNLNSYDVEFIDEAIYSRNKGEKDEDYINRINKVSETYYHSDDGPESFDMYTQLPVTITERTKALAYEITQNCRNNFEKAEKIAEYLQKNYTYSLTPKNIPEGQDFVDHFLFDEKQGYCVYFATAMTVLCRSVDIPARFVRGFKDAYRFKQKDTVYEMSNKDSHAWCEVYVNPFEETYKEMNNLIRPIKPFWVIMDPTSTPNEVSVQHLQEEDRRAKAIGVFMYDGSNIKKKVNNTDSDVYKNLTPNHNYRPNSLNIDEKTAKSSNKLIVIAIVLFIFLLLTILRICWILLKNQRIRKNKKIKMIYAHSMKLVSFIGYKKNLAETDLEFAARISDEEVSEIILNTVKAMNKHYYGRHYIKRHDTKDLERLKSIVKSRGKFNYYINIFFHY